MNPKTYINPQLDTSTSTNQEHQLLDINLDSEPDELTASDELDWLNEGIQLFLAFFAQDPETDKYIEKIFSSHLDHTSLEKTTGINFYNALHLYLGEENAEFILEAINQSLEDENILAHLKTLDFKTWKLICILTSLYGQKIKKIFQDQEDSPNSWRLVLPKINYDYISEELSISLGIEKYNGETTTYDESPSSLVQLISIMLKILNQVPIEYINGVSKEMIDELREEYEEFAELIVS
jgi:hypothetical protein